MWEAGRVKYRITSSAVAQGTNHIEEHELGLVQRYLFMIYIVREQPTMLGTGILLNLPITHFR